MSTNPSNLRTLVLNQSFMPHSVFPLSTVMARDAIVGYLTGKVDVVYWYSRPILTPSRTDLYWPSVIVTKQARKFVNKVKLNRDTLYYRDSGKCFWCDIPLTNKKYQKNSMTIDHVIPTSKGGGEDWDNVVACCSACNVMKGSSMPTGRWKPQKQIYEPTFFQMLEIRNQFPLIIDDENWRQFLPNFTEENTRIREYEMDY